MPFLYGGHVVKAHVGRFTEDTPEHQGVVVLSMDDKPLGFGVTARSTPDARRLDPTGIVCFRQADCGGFLSLFPLRLSSIRWSRFLFLFFCFFEDPCWY